MQFLSKGISTLQFGLMLKVNRGTYPWVILTKSSRPLPSYKGDLSCMYSWGS